MLHNDARKLFSVDGIEFADAGIGHLRARRRCGFEFDEVPPTGSLPGRDVNELLWIMRCGDADGTQIAIPMVDDEESRSEPVSEPRKDLADFGVLARDVNLRHRGQTVAATYIMPPSQRQRILSSSRPCAALSAAGSASSYIPGPRRSSDLMFPFTASTTPSGTFVRQ